MICNINIARFKEALENFQVREDDELEVEGSERVLTINAGGHEFNVHVITFKLDGGHLSLGNGSWAEFMREAFKTVAEKRENKKLLEKTNMGDSYNG